MEWLVGAWVWLHGGEAMRVIQRCLMWIGRLVVVRALGAVEVQQRPLGSFQALGSRVSGRVMAVAEG